MASFAWVVATPSLKRKQQVLKPRDSPSVYAVTAWGHLHMIIVSIQPIVNLW